MTAKIIDRPVLALVISLILLFLGVLALLRLPREQFPTIAPAEVNVSVEYAGANAETVTKTAIIPLEKAINGVPGMKYMTSDIGNDGVGVIEIFFEIGTDPDIAGVNVQNRMNAVMGELPPEVLKNGVKVVKEERGMLMYLNIFSSDSSLQEKFIYNFAELNVIPELKRIKGVGYCSMLGAKQYAMRIWLKPDKMLAYKISTDEVLNVLNEQNVEAALGKIGESSDKKSQALQYTIKYAGKFNTKEEYENIPLKSTERGQILKIKDIAEVEFGTTYFDVEAKLNGKPCAAIMLKQLPGSNASEVIANVKKQIAELKEKSFLKGMDYEVSYDVARFLEASMREVLKTFIEAFLLVALVVFIFLQNWRSTLIPAIAIPVSLVGTFFFIQFLGFSLNLITLFALVLAIGIVVDNAIVVVEAVHVKMEQHKMEVRSATEAAMKEISGAITTITLVMSAVFIPVAFMSGPSGIFYRQFSLTMAISIALSGVVALTLTPALCVLLLKNSQAEQQKKIGLAVFFNGFNKWYFGLEDKYKVLLNRIASRRVVTFSVLLAFILGTGILGKILQAGFIPDEDQGTFYASITCPAGATLERTKEIVNAIQQEAAHLEGIESISTLAGKNILSEGTGATYGTALINLKPWHQRNVSADEIAETLKAKTNYIKGAEIEFFPPPAVPGYGDFSGFELRLLDKTGSGDLKRMEVVVNQLISDLKAHPEIKNVFTIFDATFPQYAVQFDMDKAAQKGVTVNNVMSSLQTFLGSEYASNFIRFGQLYKVMVQALPEYRASPENLLKLYVKNDQEEMVPLSSFMTMEKTYGVDQITRFNMFMSAELNGDAKPGVSSGTVLKIIQKTAKEKLPRNFDIDWAGISKDEVNIGNEAIYIFLICLVFVYLLLSAQYESFILPLPVIFSLPPGVFGAFFLLAVLGLENNVYAQVAMLMLIGLLGKNAVLIVEFAKQRHTQGKSPLLAAIEGAKVRLRPILMTSLVFIAGLLPLMLASGPGGVGNRTIGTAAAGGMLFGTAFGIIIVPGLYVIFARLAEKLAKNKHDGSTFSDEIELS